MDVLAVLQPLDPVTGNRVTLRAASAQKRAITGLGGVRWWPSILRKPVLSLRVFDGDFSSAVLPGAASLPLSLAALERLDPNVRRYLWQGATIALMAGNAGDSWPWPTIFTGKVSDFRAEGNRLELSAEVDATPFDAQVPTATYAGTGGLEGGADIKGRVKPWLVGFVRFVEPVLINATDSVFQFSAYAKIKAVTALYERGAQFSAAVADHPNYAALVGATIPHGRWATCLAQGLVRLGAPPAGTITGDVEGDYDGNVFTRLPGAVIARAAALAGISSGLLDATSLAALDAAAGALPGGGNINIALTQQQSVMDLASRIARSCNFQAGVSFAQTLFVTKPEIGTPVLTLDAQGRRLPAVKGATELSVSPPYKEIRASGVRCWRVLQLEEIASLVNLTDRGTYDAGTTYREGDIVNLADGSKWLFIGVTPLAGSTPDVMNANWQLISGPTEVDWTNVGGGGKPEDNATRNVFRGDYSALASYDPGDVVNWPVAGGGDGAGYGRIGTGQTTGTAPSDGTKWALFVEAGATGASGIDGIDGTDGKLVEFVWKRAASAPSAPTGDGIPAGWSDDPPTGSDPLWMSKAKQELDGTLVSGESWSTPIRHDGPPGTNGTNGTDGTDGADGSDGYSVTPGGKSVAVACNSAGIPKSGELPRTVTFIVLHGTSDISTAGGTSYAITDSSGVSASLSSNVLTISSIGADTGQVEVTVSVSSVPIGVVLVDLYKVRDGVSASSRATDTITPGNSGSYGASGSDTMVIPVGPGTITLDAQMNYIVSSGSSQQAAKWQYRTTPGSGSWTDVAAETTDPTSASATEPSGFAIYETLSGPAGPENWEFWLATRRAGGASTNAVANGFNQASVMYAP